MCSVDLRSSFKRVLGFNRLHKLHGIDTTSCKSTWDAVPYFGLNGLCMILCLWSPLHPLSMLLALQDHAQNLEVQLWMKGRMEVSVISHRLAAIWSRKGQFSWKCLNIFATDCSTSRKSFPAPFSQGEIPFLSFPTPPPHSWNFLFLFAQCAGKSFALTPLGVKETETNETQVNNISITSFEP